MVNNEFPTSDKLIQQNKAPQSIEVGEAFAKPEWIGENERFWITREKWVYKAHSQKLEEGRGPNAGKMHWYYITDCRTNPRSNTLADAVKFVERQRKSQQKQKQLAAV